MLGTHPDCLATPEAKFNAVAYRQSFQEHGAFDLASSFENIRMHWSFQVFGVGLEAADHLRKDPNASYTDLVMWIVQEYGRKVGKEQISLWIDHTPSNILHARALLDLYPDAKLLHLVRDGRAVAASVMKLDWGPNTVDRAAQWWVYMLAHGFAAELHYGPERVMRVSYENLVSNPAATLQAVSTFLGIEYDEGMVNGSGFQSPAFASLGHDLIGSRPDNSRIGAWREELNAREIEIFENIGGAVLQYLGYTLLHRGRARRMSETERLKALTVDLYRQMTNRLHRRQRLTKAVASAGNTSTVLPVAQGDRV
jgi:hypothetical protein